ncbi:SEC10/PgrA surface exclusion domain-containing protein [Streptococcus sinensis]|uniref:Gram-positive cocci surface proteins LPxTG domain-containing protein n=1 Tax=Streptococcus sinensis TaxID=176090 RepID=A0A0A0DFY3_9STRE|nr:SEC10/PgrA surface exclusion domain-containing protein [Streptococcus sinensis]KGM37009.1 hypothetical protein SSIN_1151 [Streptococcus sinensis]
MEIMNEVKKVVLASAILTGAVGATNQVLAEEVKPLEPILGSEQQAVEKHSAVTATDVAISQEQVDKADSAVKFQEGITNAAQAEVTSAEKTVKEIKEAVTQAEEAVKEATPENIQQAKASVAAKEGAEKQAQDDLKTAEATQMQAEKSVTEQEAKVTEATSKLADKEGEVTAAEQVVAEKQAILDGTGVADVVAKAETAKNNLEASKEAVSQAQTELTAAKQADARRASELKEAESEVRATEADKLTKEQALAQATAQADQTEAQYQVAKEKLSKTQSLLDSLKTSSITYPAGYAEALKAYFNNPTEENSNKLQEIAKKGMIAAGFSSPDGGKTYYSNPASPFKPSEADKKVLISDVNNLSTEVQEALAAFNAQLINDFRRLMGTDDIPVLVNRDMQKVAQKATQLSTNQYGHDQDALNTAAKEVGLVQGNQGLLSENIGYQSPSDVVTLADLKQQAYNNLVMMMFYDKHADWGHALNFSGLDRESVMLQYIGVATRKLDRGLVAMHYVGTDSKTIDLLKNRLHQDVKIDTKNNVASIEGQIKAAQKSLAQAQTTFTAAKGANDATQAKKTQAQSAYEEAKSTAERAVAQRAAIQNTALKTPAAEAKLTQAETELAKADSENKDAQATLAQLNADVQTKRKVLEAAKEKLAEKQAERETLNEALMAEKAVLATKQAELGRTKEVVTNHQKALKEAQNDLKASQERVEILQTAPQLLEKAKVALATAQKVLKEKKSVLEAAQAKLEAAKAVQSKVVAAHKELVSAYRAYLAAQKEAEHQEKLAAQKASIEQAGGNPVPVVQNGKIVDYVRGQVQNQATKVTNPVYQAPAVSRSTGLPKTGEELSSLGLFGVVTISLLSFLRIKRKSEVN